MPSTTASSGATETAATTGATETSATIGTTETSGSTGTPTLNSTTAGADVDPEALVELALDYESLETVNDMPVSSVHGLADTMNVWVSPSVAQEDQALADGVVFEPETIFVKEQLDPQGQLDSLAVMFEGPDGYAPQAGDWWFGLVRGDGSIGVGGQPGACVDRHAMAESTDWDYGLEG